MKTSTKQLRFSFSSKRNEPPHSIEANEYNFDDETHQNKKNKLN